MNTNALKRFAKEARIKLLDQVGRKLEFVLANKSQSFIDTYSSQINSLKNRIQKVGKEQVIEMVAYTWFNRLMALRFMDANGYTIPQVVTPLPGMTNPEVLQNALGGNIELELHFDRQRLSDLLDGKTAAIDAHTEAFKMLLVASCNQWHSAMPFMFERISDYTELLLPDDLLSDYSIVVDIRNGMNDEDCQQEELIGWLYQFYISDKKDDVFEGLKKNIKITAENIPAATQLFTPHWIVRYMVENTLGKLWLTLKPNSKLKQHMPYFIEAPEGNAPAPLPDGIKGVTDITFLDPCQGSGHVLVYAFALFTKIYEEEGYNTNEIPTLILQHNLFGIDIDERAAQLAAFALTMKARNYYTRFLRKPLQPHVIALENVSEDIIKQAVKIPLAVGGKLIYDYRDLSLNLLTQADNYGSLIQIDPEELKALHLQKGSLWQEQELKMVQQAEYLSRQYHCVVTNPPYMGNGGMNESLGEYVKLFYPKSKSDLMTCFMERSLNFVIKNGYLGMINLPSWMFLPSFEKLRDNIISTHFFESLIHLGRGIFGSDFGSVTFVIRKAHESTSLGVYRRLFKEHVQVDAIEEKEKRFLNKNYGYFVKNQQSFKVIPGSPIGYWLSDRFLATFNNEKVGTSFRVASGLSTSNNVRFLRYWWEVSFNKVKTDCKSIEETKITPEKWFPFQKGGDYRKWYGNLEHVVNWENNGSEIKRFVVSNPKDPDTTHWSRRIFNIDVYFKEGIIWSTISSGPISFRWADSGSVISNAAGGIFLNNGDSDIKILKGIILFLNSRIGNLLINTINPTINYSSGVISKCPNIFDNQIFPIEVAESNIKIAKTEWNSKETSIDFTHLNIIKRNSRINEIISSYSENIINEYKELRKNEELINNILIKELDLGDEVPANITDKDINLYSSELEIKNNDIIFIPTEKIKQIISYSIGCLLGRFSLDKYGLVLANQEETFQDYLVNLLGFSTISSDAKELSFLPDEDNIIPVLDGEWFTDDVVGRFKIFLKAAFGEEHFEENLRYIEETIGKDIRKYFVKDFYNDHVKRYKKRPIYWMFSSPKGHFKALIYMHRYQPDLCSKLLNDYLQAFISKLEASKQTQTMFSLREDISAREKNAAIKEIDKLELMLRDCRQYEKTLFTIATQKISIDLDDGVKVNYQKFKEVLVPIKGLEKEEE
ncbi:MAG: BREX-1 system adenine-specific DNA-methyltransferase PglX [Bacteroidetes bacterium]|nr:BREX-1 system adenine-specific DNA-methyltransferase PglX [Bacteroidota bacterium]